MFLPVVQLYLVKELMLGFVVLDLGSYVKMHSNSSSQVNSELLAVIVYAWQRILIS